jgi:hypothetical protein
MRTTGEPRFINRTTQSLITPLAIALFALGQTTYAGKLKVFILAGQSNMEGHAKIETFDYIGDDAKTAPLLDSMRGPQGAPRICEDVWISYLTGSGANQGEGHGKLTAGYGARKDPQQSGGKIGPEFTFGITMEQALEEPVLIIKTAWGGKSLFHDFRPPSAGVYKQSEKDIERNRHTPETSGHYYRLMVNHVKKTLKDIKRIYPEYDPISGYELSGVVWFQGFNDMVNRDTYPILPKDSKANRFANYGTWMADFIRDVRNDLKSPDLPIVIGVMGVGGLHDVKEHNQQFRSAMAAPTQFDEFKGTVTAVQTARFWDDELAEIANKRQQLRGQRNTLNKKVSAGEISREQSTRAMAAFEANLITPQEAAQWTRGASNQGYHYLGSAKTFALIGKAFAEATLDLMQQRK